MKCRNVKRNKKRDKNERRNETLLRFMDKYNITSHSKKRKLKKKEQETTKKTMTKHDENVVTNPLEFELPNLSQGF